jgi:predicted nucleic acid-binding protein
MSALRKTVVLDSNLVVSAFLNSKGAASQAMQLAFDYFDVAASKDTLTELVDVLRRDKFDRYANK